METTGQKTHSNIDTIYDYTQYQIDSINQSVATLNNKISVVLIIAFFLLFSFVAPVIFYKSWAYIILFFINIILVSAAIVQSFWCLWPSGAGSVILPKILIEEYYYASSEDCKLVIVKTWVEALQELVAWRNEKANKLKLAICLSLASVFVTLIRVIVAVVVNCLR